MVFTSFISERYQQKVMSQAACKAERVQLEIDEFGVSRAQLAALLLGLWRLPESVVSAVANQHSQNKSDFIDAPVSTALMIADFLVEDTEVEEHLDGILELLPDHELDSWRDRIDAAAAIA